MALTWWRNALIRSRKTSALTTRRRRLGVILHLEFLEDRLAPSGNTYRWTGGGGTDTSWNNPANWMPVAGATGVYPGDGADGMIDVVQFVGLSGTSVSVKVNGAFSIGQIDFGSAANVTLASDGVAGHGLTLTGSATIVSADTFGAPPSKNTGSDEIAAPVTVPVSLTVTNSAATPTTLVRVDTVTLGSGAAITTSGSNNVQLGTLQTTGNDTLTVNTPTALATNLAGIASTDTLLIQGTSTLRIAGPSTFPGTVILSGATVTVSVGNNQSLGTGALALFKGTLQASATGLTLNNSLTLVSGGSVALGDPTNGLTLGGSYALPTSFTIQDNGGVAWSGVGSLSGSAVLTVNGTSPLVLGSLALPGNSSLTLPGTDAVTIGGSVHLGSSTLSLAPSAGLTLSGNIIGSGGLTGSGPATTILSGTDSYSGATTISGGTLQFGGGIVPLGPLATSAIIDNGSLVFDDPSGQTLSYGGPISGSGGLTQIGSWTLTLTGNNSYTGPTSIAPGGTLNAASNTAVGNGDVTVPTGSVLNVQTPGGALANLGTGLPGTYYSTLGATTYPPPAFNSLTTLLAFATSSNLGPPITTDTSATPNGTNNGGTVFDYGSTGAGFPAAVQNVNPSGGNPTQFMGLWGVNPQNGLVQGVFLAPVAGTYTFDTGSAGSSMLFVDGYPVVNNNFINQALTVRSGTVNLTVGAHSLVIAYCLQSGPYGFFADVQGPGLPQERIPNALMGTMSPTLLQLGSLSGGGTVNLSQNTTTPNNGILVGTDNSSTTFSGTITAIGTTTANFPNLVKAGSGTFVLTNGESYQGGTGISGGTLQLGTAANPISSLPTSTISDYGTLAVYLPSNSPLTYSGVISGTGGVSLGNLGGTLNLSGTNTYTGPTVVGGNTVVQLTANALPPLSVFTVGSGSSSGVVDLNGFSGGLGGITALGTGTGNAVTNSAGKTVTLTLTGLGFPLYDNVPITGNMSLLVTGSGSELLSAANSYTGKTTISGSTVIAGNAGVFPANTTLTVNHTGVLDLNGYSFSVASLRGFGTGIAITNSSATMATLTITGPSGGNSAGAITGAVSLNDAGGFSAVTTLGGGPSSTYFGGVTATSGTLVGGPGSFGSGTVTINGGTVQLTSSAAALGFGSNGAGWTLDSVGDGIQFLGTDVLQLTNSAGTQASSFFYDTPVQPGAGFTASFLYQDQTPGSVTSASGITFTVEADPQGPFALGGTGGSLGYGPGGSATNPDGSIKNSVAIALNLFSGAAGGIGTALDTNGVINPTVNPGGSFNMLASGDPIEIALTYNPAAQLLSENLTDMKTGATTFASFTGVNLLSLLGSANAYIGFTGATGAAGAAQEVTNFTYLSSAGAVAVFPNSFQVNPTLNVILPLTVNSLVSAYVISGNLNVPNAAALNVSPVTASNQPYSLTIGGSTALVGTINIANNGTGTATLNLNGSISGVGATIGSIGGNGNVNLGSGATYNVVLGGTGAGQFTDLTVGGALNLSGGNLTVSFASGFAPAVGQSFTIATSGGTLTGTFHQGSTITAGGVTFSITYNHGSVVLTPTSMVTPTELVISAPSTATAGVPIPLIIAAEDANGNIAGNFNGVVTLTSTSGSIEPTSAMLTGGSATVDILLTIAILQTITATSSGLAPGTEPIDVLPDDFAEYLVSDPQTAAGTNFLVQVQATDKFGNPVTSYTGPPAVTVSLDAATPASNFPLSISMGSNGLGIALGQIDQAGMYSLTATSGSYSSNSASMTVIAGPPIKLGFAAQPVNTPLNVTLAPVMVQVLDAYGNVVTSDNTDTVTLGVASGPGSFTASSTTTGTLHNGSVSFTNLAFSTPGTYTLSASVSSQFNGPSSTPFTIAPLQVLPGSFTGSPSGFSLTLNAPFLVNSMTPILYGAASGATEPVPSVTLTQIMDGSGNQLPTPIQVFGSLVLSPATNSLTFVVTNTTSEINNDTPVLPDGTYVARVSGTAADNGFESVDGGSYLDGTNVGTPGSDFTATLTVAAAAAKDDVVWVPATADGPGQTLNAPGGNQAGGGYPVYLDDNTGAVTNVAVTFNYNPSYLALNASATSANPALPGSTFSLNPALSSPGHAVLTYSGPVTDEGALLGNPVPLGFINAHVPKGSSTVPIYRGKDLLRLSAVSVNGGTIAAIGDNAVHLVAYVGDADGNGFYSANDAVLITRAALQTDSGFAAYPLVDPVIVADTDGAGFIPADGALQANEAGVGVHTANLPLPPIPSGVNVTPVGNNVDPAVSLPGKLEISPDGTVIVPVIIDDAHPAGSTGLIEAHLALTYDPSIFTVSMADIRLGSLMAASNGWTLTSTINAVSGQIAIALSSTTPVTNSLGGSLVIIDFHQRLGEPGLLATEGVTPVVENARGSPGLASIALVASVNPTGTQVVTTELEDAQGTFTLTPAPMNGFDSRIDSSVSLIVPAAGSPVPEQAEPGTVSLPVLAEPESIQVRAVDATSGMPEISVLPQAGAFYEQRFVPIRAVSPGADGIEVHAIGASHDAAFAGIGLTLQLANGPMISSSVLMSNWLFPPSGLDRLDRVEEEMMRAALNAQPGDVSPVMGRHGVSTMLTDQPDVEQAALDQFFAKLANFADYSLDEE